MKNSNLLIAAVVLVVISLIIVIQRDDNSQGAAAAEKKTISTIEKVSKIDTITLETAEDLITLKKSGNIWTVNEKNDFPAENEKVETLFQKLIDTKIMEKVSSNPERFSRMGLEMPAENQKPGPEQILMALSSDQGSKTQRWILGKGRTAQTQNSPYGGGEEGQYVRRTDSNDAHLIASKIWIDKKLSAWIKKKIFGIEKNEIKKLDFQFADNQNNFEISRELTSEALALKDIEEGKQLKKSSLDGITNFFQNVTIDDVVPVGETIEKDGMQEVITVSADTFDGITYTMRLGSKKVTVPGSGEFFLASIAAEYSGTDSDKAEEVKVISEMGAKWVFAFREWRLNSVKSKKSDLLEDKPKPVIEEPAVPAVNNTDKAKLLEKEGQVPEDFLKAGDAAAAEALKAATPEAGTPSSEASASETTAPDASTSETAAPDSPASDASLESEPKKIENFGASHILVAYTDAQRSTAKRTKDEALKIAEDLLEQIKKGKDLGELAAKHSDCSSASKKGDLGIFSKGAMTKPFEDALIKLETGEISEIVETEFGYHIIKRTK
jgi:parvulin-like peptidyl-prolyl isomerase